MQAALERYGSMSWREVIEPALILARDGFTVTQDLHYNLKRAQERLSKSSYSQELYTAPAMKCRRWEPRLNFPIWHRRSKSSQMRGLMRSIQVISLKKSLRTWLPMGG